MDMEGSLYRRLLALRTAVQGGAATHLQNRAVGEAMAPPAPVVVGSSPASSDNSDRDGQAKEFREQGFLRIQQLCSAPEDCAALSQLGLDLSTTGSRPEETAVLETTSGASLLRALGQDRLCQLLADVVGTDVQAISLQPQTTAAAGGAAVTTLGREYCRSEPQLRTHGAFAHPFLCSHVKLLLPLSSSGVTIDLIPGSQHWIEGSPKGIDLHSAVACKIELGSALLVDMRTWRSYVHEQPAAGQFALEVLFSKVRCQPANPPAPCRDHYW